MTHCIDYIKIKIDEFAVKHGFVQQKDINRIESDERSFDKKEYDQIHNKNYIGLMKVKREDKIFVEVGKIQIEMDTLEEEDYYSIDKNIFFSIPFLEDSIIEDILDNVLNHVKPTHLQ